MKRRACEFGKVEEEYKEEKRSALRHQGKYTPRLDSSSTFRQLARERGPKTAGTREEKGKKHSAELHNSSW